MIRPHPAVWKVMHGMFVLYLLFLVFLLCQGRRTMRSHIGVSVPGWQASSCPSAYGGDCQEIYTPEDPSSKFRVLRDTIFDEFFISPISWAVMARLLR